ncbi:MAG: PqqD family protein [Bacteroidetes bacterium]|nr:PqqD family protein [Bacteroidota bacterium]
MLTKKDKKKEYNLLELTPRRLRDHDVDEEGIVTVKYPRFETAVLSKFLVPSWKRPYVRMRLDRFGSYVWLHSDGDRTVDSIAEGMLEEFGEEAEPVYDRLKSFLLQLHRARYLTLQAPDGTTVR